MASGINPLKTVYSVNLGNIGDKSSKITNAIANNTNPNISTFHAIFGRQLNSTATRGNSIVENMGLSSSLLSTAQTAISSLTNQLQDMKNDLLGLSDASPALLAIGQTTYQNKVASVIAFIRDASFGEKKLFDGSLAAATVPNSGIIANPSPLQIQIGFNSFITRALSRLLGGDASQGSGLDPVASGSFQPLFRVTLAAAGTEARRIQQSLTNVGTKADIDGLGAPGNTAGDAVNAAAKKAAKDANDSGLADTTAPFKAYVLNATIDAAAAQSAGDVTTPAGRAAITTKLDAAINILNGIGAQLTGDLDSLEVGKAAVEQQIISLTAAANTILSADYEKLVPELTELRRLVTILSMAFGIEETILNTVIDKLESLAR